MITHFGSPFEVKINVISDLVIYSDLQSKYVNCSIPRKKTTLHPMRKEAASIRSIPTHSALLHVLSLCPPFTLSLSNQIKLEKAKNL